MSRNTKFMGFVGDSQIALERWGSVATVQLSEDSIGALRKACYEELPRGLQRRQGDVNSEAGIRYNSDMDCIDIRLSAKDAERLTQILELLVEAKKLSPSISEGQEQFRSWFLALKEGLKHHEEHIDTKDGSEA